MGKTSHVRGLYELTLLRWQYHSLPKLIITFSTIPIRIGAGIFVEIDKWIIKFLCNYKGPRIGKSVLKKTNADQGDASTSQGTRTISQGHH